MALNGSKGKLCLFSLLACISIQLIALASNEKLVEAFWNTGPDECQLQSGLDPDNSEYPRDYVTVLEYRPNASFYHILIASARDEYVALNWKADEQNDDCLKLDRATVRSNRIVEVVDNAGHIIMKKSTRGLNGEDKRKLNKQLRNILCNYNSLQVLGGCYGSIPLVPMLNWNYDSQCATKHRDVKWVPPASQINEDIYCFNKCKKIERIHSNKAHFRENSTLSVLWRETDGLISYASEEIEDNRRFLIGNKRISVDPEGAVSLSHKLDNYDERVQDLPFISSPSTDGDVPMFCH